MKRVDGDREAFPVGLDVRGGLTKREYFAGLAMQSIQNVLVRRSGHEMGMQLSKMVGIDPTDKLAVPKTIAKLAVIQADHLLLALQEEENA